MWSLEIFLSSQQLASLISLSLVWGRKKKKIQVEVNHRSEFSYNGKTRGWNARRGDGQTGKHTLRPWVDQSQPSPNKTDVHKSQRHFGSFMQPSPRVPFSPHSLKSTLCFLPPSPHSSLIGHKRKHSTTHGMNIPRIFSSLLKSKSPFHTCCTKSACLVQASVNVVTHGVLAKDDRSTEVRLQKSQTGYPRSYTSARVGQYYLFLLPVCLA